MPTPEQLARISDINSAYPGIDTLQLMENARMRHDGFEGKVGNNLFNP